MTRIPLAVSQLYASYSLSPALQLRAALSAFTSLIAQA